MTARFGLSILFSLLLSVVIFGQTTNFTYQGRLIDGSMPANGTFEFEFRLYDVDEGGTPLGTLQRGNVTVTTGVFTVQLDFGSVFTGEERWLEILVRRTGDPDYTLLSPRQEVVSTPYAIRSLNSLTAVNSLQLNGIGADQYVLTTDSRMDDARDPLPGSGNYIQNTITQQSGSYNINGSGTIGGTLSAGLVTSDTQYNIGGQRVFSIAGTSNTFAGALSGAVNTTGNSNSFFGTQAGFSNTSGNTNSFFGERAGSGNTSGFANSFFGSTAGSANTTGSANAFFGVNAGRSNTTASNNSFFGAQAGFGNTTGTDNSFYGRDAGAANMTGNRNSFYGRDAGRQSVGDNNSFFGANSGANNIASDNSFFGASSGESNSTGQFNAFFGASSGRINNADNNSFFGYFAGRFNTSGSGNSFFGASAGLSNTTGGGNSFFGRDAGKDNTTGGGNTFVGRWSGVNNTIGGDNTFVGFNSGLLNEAGAGNVFIGTFAGSFNTSGTNNTIIGSNADVASGSNLQFATAVGASVIVSSSNTIQLGRTNGFDTVFAPGLIRVNGLGASGSTDLCRNASNVISTCSSSLRYKSGIVPFSGGLDIVRRLRPIEFSWTDGGKRDIGFGAEDVFQIEPLLTTRNDQDEIEGVKYKQITTVLVNAVTELSEENDSLKKEIAAQRAEISALRQALCRLAPSDAVCKEEK